LHGQHASTPAQHRVQEPRAVNSGILPVVNKTLPTLLVAGCSASYYVDNNISSERLINDYLNANIHMTADKVEHSPYKLLAYLLSPCYSARASNTYSCSVTIGQQLPLFYSKPTQGTLIL